MRSPRVSCQCVECGRPLGREDEIVQVQTTDGIHTTGWGRRRWAPERLAHIDCVRYMRNRTWKTISTKRKEELMRTLPPKVAADEKKVVEATMNQIEAETPVEPLTVEFLQMISKKWPIGGLVLMKLPPPFVPDSDVVALKKEQHCSGCAAALAVGERAATVGPRRYCRRCVRKFLKEAAAWLYA